MKLVARKAKTAANNEVKKPRMSKLAKMCEECMLRKVKHYQTDFYNYDVPRLNRLKKPSRAILILRETGTYLAVDTDFKSRGDWEFYRAAIETWKNQYFFYINFQIDKGEPSWISEESAVELINSFYHSHLLKASLDYSTAEDKYYSPKGITSNMKCPQVEDFGMTPAEYNLFTYKNVFNEVLLDRSIKTAELSKYV